MGVSVEANTMTECIAEAKRDSRDAYFNLLARWQSITATRTPVHFLSAQHTFDAAADSVCCCCRATTKTRPLPSLWPHIALNMKVHAACMVRVHAHAVIDTTVTGRHSVSYDGATAQYLGTYHGPRARLTERTRISPFN